MRVIVKGKSPKKWTKKVICDECKAVLEVEESDLKVVNHQVNWGGDTEDLHVECQCAVCKSVINLTNEIPSGIQQALFNEARKRKV